MATDHSLPVRRGLVTAIKANEALNTLTGGRIYGEAAPVDPVRPFIRVGLIIAAPWEATGLSGMKASVNIDAVSDHADASEAYTLSRKLVDLLDQETPDLPDDSSTFLSIDWKGTTPRKEGSLFRLMVAFSITTQSSTD